MITPVAATLRDRSGSAPWELTWRWGQDEFQAEWEGASWDKSDACCAERPQGARALPLAANLPRASGRGCCSWAAHRHRGTGLRMKLTLWSVMEKQKDPSPQWHVETLDPLNWPVPLTARKTCCCVNRQMNHLQPVGAGVSFIAL